MNIIKLDPSLFTVITVNGKYAVKYDAAILSTHYTFVGASKQIEMIKLLDYKGLRELVNHRIQHKKDRLADDLLKCTMFLAKTMFTANLLGDLSNYFPVLTEEDVYIIKSRLNKI